MSRSGGGIAGGIGDTGGADIDGDVTVGIGDGCDDEGVEAAADGGEGARGAVAEGDLAGIKAGDGF